MTRIHGLSLLLGLALFIAVIHNVATENFWYWKYWWLDIGMHFLGGAFIAGVVLLADIKRKLVTVVGAVLVVGTGWELFEFVTKLSYSAAFIPDTTLDLVMDACGAATLYAIMSKWEPKSQSTLPEVQDA